MTQILKINADKENPLFPRLTGKPSAQRRRSDSEHDFNVRKNRTFAKKKCIMQESITIKNFGPVKDIVIDDIQPFTVFIGESGSGKSAIIKVVVLFRWIYKMLNIRSYLKYANISQSPFNFDFGQYLKNNGFSDYLKPDTDIIYQKGSIIIHYKKALRTSPIAVPKEELSLEKMNFIADKRNLIPDILAAKKNDKIPMSFFLEETL